RVRREPLVETRCEAVLLGGRVERGERVLPAPDDAGPEQQGDPAADQECAENSKRPPHQLSAACRSRSGSRRSPRAVMATLRTVLRSGPRGGRSDARGYAAYRPATRTTTCAAPAAHASAIRTDTLG